MTGNMAVNRASYTHERKRLHLLISFHRKSLLVRDQNKLIELIGQEVKEILEADRATIFLLDKNARELYGKFAIGLDGRQLEILRFPVTQGIAGYVARTGKPCNVRDAYGSPHFNPAFDRLTHYKTKSVLAVPLKGSNSQTIGVLAAFNKTNGKYFNKEDEGLLLLLAGQLSATFEIFQLLQDLKFANLESLYALAQTAEFRDQEDTGPHIRRVGSYAALLAESIGLPTPAIEIIRATSPLHDIGKVAIRDDILRKPGAFTPEESVEMKRHALYGYEMLKDFKSPLLQAAASIALSHHEKYDGTGYPSQLKGEQIPLEGRIVCLTDAFDAMTSKRVYKLSKPLKESAQEVAQLSGAQFDPMLADAFIKNFPKFEEVYHQGHQE